MRVIQLTRRDLDPDADRLAGHHLDARHYDPDRLVRSTTTVVTPEGRPVITYLEDAVQGFKAAFGRLRGLPLQSSNRGQAAGGNVRPMKRDGTRSRTAQTKSVPSGLLGFMDREPRTPYCRETALTRAHEAVFAGVLPLVQAVDRQFSLFARERWEAQRLFVDTLSEDWVIGGTVFTTMTVNRNVRTTAHRDKGDYRPGLGMIAAMGDWEGGELIFPRYRTAVDLRPGGLLLADVHELHGNAPIWGRKPVRLSVVLYARERMAECGTPEQEWEHAAERSEPL
jgi:hypothetical protein